MDFVIHLRETSVPTVIVNQLNLTPAAGGTGGSIDLSILIYLSDYARGTAFDDLPEIAPATPMMVSQATDIETETETDPTATPTRATTETPTPAPETVSITATPTVLSVTIQSQNIVGPGTYNDDNTAIVYTAGEWQEISDSRSGFGSNYHFSTDTNAELQFQFVGTDIALQYIAYRNSGIFEIEVDGVFQGEVDAYAPDGIFGQVVYVTGLENGLHTLTVRNTDRHNPASESNVIAVDAIHVLTSNPTDGN